MRRFSLETKKKFTGITHGAMEKLLAYDWPGNVRELGNAIERAVVLWQGPKVTLQDLSSILIAGEPKMQSKCLSYHEAMDGAKRDLSLNALSRTQGNRAEAAKLLGLQRTYLSRLIKTLRIE